MARKLFRLFFGWITYIFYGIAKSIVATKQEVAAKSIEQYIRDGQRVEKSDAAKQLLEWQDISKRDNSKTYTQLSGILRWPADLIHTVVEFSRYAHFFPRLDYIFNKGIKPEFCIDLGTEMVEVKKIVDNLFEEGFTDPKLNVIEHFFKAKNISPTIIAMILAYADILIKEHPNYTPAVEIPLDKPGKFYKTRKYITDDDRTAIIAELNTGKKVGEVAKQFDVSHTTVSAIKKSLQPQETIK
jgi:hypothetical protein